MKRILLVLPLLVFVAMGTAQAQEQDSTGFATVIPNPTFNGGEHMIGEQWYVTGGAVYLANGFTVNYEKVTDRKYLGGRLAWRAGLGAVVYPWGLFSPGNHAGLTVPLSAKAIYGKNDRHFFVETGIYLNPVAVAWWTSDIDGQPEQRVDVPWVPWLMIDFGYRYHSPSKNLIYQASLGSSGLSMGIGKTF